MDQDFLPVGTAPGNGPDLIFEFEDFIVIGEVTLTDNSRQVAAEGESVRRHVAEKDSQYSAEQKRKVYGLFIANKIDDNTVEEFRVGSWYHLSKRMRLSIVPVTLTQFKNIFESLFRSGNVRVSSIRDFFEECNKSRDASDALVWKKNIEETLLGWTKTLISKLN
ncbi:MAG: AlwI family type II restriction endonuclease [Candidatus Omnitrophica bacterium]|nr:AlwI family type II restriction endonuclease [Candidatus Omnitrophota bacterium]